MLNAPVASDGWEGLLNGRAGQRSNSALRVSTFLGVLQLSTYESQNGRINRYLK